MTQGMPLARRACSKRYLALSRGAWSQPASVPAGEMNPKRVDAAALGFFQQVQVAAVVDIVVREVALEAGDADAGNDLLQPLADARRAVRAS